MENQIIKQKKRTERPYSVTMGLGPDLGNVSTNVSFAIKTEMKIGNEGIDVRIATSHATCTGPSSEGGQKQAQVPYKLSVRAAQEPVNFAASSGRLHMDGQLYHTKLDKKRKCISSNDSRSTDLLRSLKMRRVDWRYIEFS